MHPDTEANFVNTDVPYPELPTIQASFEQIAGSIKGVLGKVEQVSFKEISDALLATLKGTSQLVNSSEIQTALTELEATMTTFRELADKVDRRVDPLADNVEQAVIAGRDALRKVQGTLGLVDEVLQSDSPLQYQYIQMAEELTETARSIRVFVDLLERNPEAFIFGKPSSGGN